MGGIAGAYPILYWATFALLAAAIAYLLVLTAAAFLTPAATKGGGPTHFRFALLVPAHNEEPLLGELLRSLNALDYPRDRYRVFVVADNCTDATAAIARAHGAVVYERADSERRGKGHALQWLLEQVAARGEEHDAFVIFDADSLVAPDFLQAMAAELARGREALQGHYSVRNPAEGTGAALRFAAYALVNFLRPLGKNALGCATGLKGNGMCFSARVIARHGWSAHSLAEDAEYGVKLLLDQVPVHFVPGARVWAQMPPAVRQSESQNLRWEAGRLLVARRCVPTLLQRALRRGDLVLLEAALDLMIPPLSTLAAGVLLIAGAAWLGPPLAGARPAALLLAAALTTHMVAGLARVRAPAVVWRALGHVPAYCLWKLALYARALLRKPPSAWVRTRRFSPGR
jgi:cellulose synthase/poly-beta-1,6-N-acetylglucosamine synthase-like glycosyltransferase